VVAAGVNLAAAVVVEAVVVDGEVGPVVVVAVVVKTARREKTGNR